MRGKARPIRLFLTDDRLSDAELLACVRNLPPGVDIVVRARDPARRAALVALLRPSARRARRALYVAASQSEAVRLRADGVHLAAAAVSGARWRRRGLALSAAAHSRAELVAALRLAPDRILISPIFPTRSHPGAPGLGPLRLGLLIRGVRGSGGSALLALGSLTPARWQRLGALRHALAGWAAIGYWAGPESRNGCRGTVRAGGCLG